MIPIENSWFFAASVASLITMLLHIFLGGKDAARPLLQSKGIVQSAKYTNYYCWHLVTIYIGIMAFSFLAAAVRNEYALGLTMTFAAVLNALLNLAILISKKQSFLQMPQWFIFLVIGFLGALGISSANHLAF
ncbi:hypothetical protein [Hyphococcus sp.]|uniref:hypothetical protein n=1 Tax=Hyphococcus sp. TaxID=2038636 RepID=UPI0035C781AF